MNESKGVVANRIGTWLAIAGLAVYVFYMGQWVGAADEKLADAATVEETQRAIIVQQATMATTQEHMKTAIEDNKKAIEESTKEILEAIEKLKGE